MAVTRASAKTTAAAIAVGVGQTLAVACVDAYLALGMEGIPGATSKHPALVAFMKAVETAIGDKIRD